MKRLVILNPMGRNGKAGEVFSRMEPELRKRLGDFELYRTTGPGDASMRVRSIIEEGSIDQIIAAGGDGTVHEVVNGYFEKGQLLSNDIPMGIINLGTGGDFFKTVHEVSPDYDAAIVENRSSLIDVGKISVGGKSHNFLNISSVGLAGDMLSRLKSSSFQAGAVAYFYHTLRTLLSYQPVPVEIETVAPGGAVESRSVDLINFFVCNGKYSGGGMQWAPESNLQSGLFSLTLISGKRKLPLITHSPKLYSGRVSEFPGAEQWEAKEVIVRPQGGLSAEVDGEVLEGQGEIRFSIEPSLFPAVL